MMFQHMLEPAGTALSDLRLALAADHSSATAFVEAATGCPSSFAEPYLAERIEREELFLYEERGEILASGECRTDQRQSGYAHLGLVVGQSRRNKGLGSRLMHALVLECRRRNMKPLCSTEPANLAARRVIHKAGFCARHRVFRVALG
jgi:GNAT superfamily N-acetyltransferase